MENSKIGMIVLSVLCVILLAFTIASYTTRYSENYVLTYAGGKIAEAQEKHNTQLNAIQETLNIQITELEGTLATLQEEKASIETQLTELEASLTAEQAAHATEIADLQEQLEVIDEEIEEVESEIIHLVDELALANSFEYLISDNKLEKLFDDEVEFDNEDYDAEETFFFSGLVDINNADYAENVYLVVEEDGIAYTFTFEPTLDTSLVSEEETLTFNFLGQEVELSSWDIDEITFTTGTEYVLNHGEIITIDEKSVELKIAGEDYAYICVDEDCEKIDEETTETIGGLEIYCDFSLEGELAKLKVGDDIETTVEGGDEYSEDSIWNWAISNSAIGLVLNTDFEDLDEDDDYHALGADDIICLPNDYICFKFLGITEEDTETYTFELDEKDGSDYVKAKGNFLYELNDYDLLYIDATGFYDEDLVLIVDNTGTLTLDDTELSLAFEGADLKVDDIVLALDFTTLTVDETDITGKDDDYRTSYGTIIESPEDNFEDSELSIVVSEEALTASIKVY